MESMPVIEQAEGIIIAQSRCTPGEAFGLLRRASQRTNVPVRELAAQMVAQAAAPAPGADANAGVA
jgi:AmiR/NasT family two-component response regulator